MAIFGCPFCFCIGITDKAPSEPTVYLYHLCILQEPDYEYPEWENLCTGVCYTTCLTASEFLAAHLDYDTAIETVAVTALTDDNINFRVLLSNTTRFLPSTITWKSCTIIDGIAYMKHLNHPDPSSIGIYIYCI